MSRKFKFYPGEDLYFVSTAIVNWIDVFTRPAYKDIVVDSLRFCQEMKDLNIYSWCLMTNHLHMIINTRGRKLSHTMRDMKQFTAKRILEAIENNKQESRREWLLWHFERAGRYRAGNDKYQFWQHGNHPLYLTNRDIAFRALHYTHFNPVEAGFVEHPEQWKYGSAQNYAGLPGLLDVILLE